MIISIIVAIAENNVIGNNNTLIWHIPGDLKRFKAITMGHPVVMGRKTYESIGKPLPGRTNVIISRQADYMTEGCLVYGSVDDALIALKHEKEVFIIGGGEIYKQSMPLAHKIYLTIIHKSFSGDTYFPEIQMNKWEVVREETIPVTTEVPFSYSYIDLVRK
jgi:dihydrofolate reductase